MIIKPILKELGFDLSKQNYRLVSILVFLCKLIQRIVDHLQANNLMHTFQTAYREYHNTDTTLLKEHNYILMHLDKCNTALFVLRDLSAAFYSFDQTILLKCVEKDV